MRSPRSVWFRKFGTHQLNSGQQGLGQALSERVPLKKSDLAAIQPHFSFVSLAVPSKALVLSGLFNRTGGFCPPIKMSKDNVRGLGGVEPNSPPV